MSEQFGVEHLAQIFCTLSPFHHTIVRHPKRFYLVSDALFLILAQSRTKVIEAEFLAHLHSPLYDLAD